MAGVDTMMGLVAQGRRLERERIIALLEAELGNLYGPDRERLIALIEGENK